MTAPMLFLLAAPAVVLLGVHLLDHIERRLDDELAASSRSGEVTGPTLPHDHADVGDPSAVEGDGDEQVRAGSRRRWAVARSTGWLTRR